MGKLLTLEQLVPGSLAASGPETDIRDIPHDAIAVGSRHRKDLGDIPELAANLKELGQLQPIGVTHDFRLIWGQRRLAAAKMLGWPTISARVIDIENLLDAEAAENIARKDFTVSEQVAIGLQLEIDLGERRGGDRGNQHTGGKRQGIGGCRGRTDDLASRKAGFGNRETYRQAKFVCERGCTELIRRMDAGELSITAAAKLARLPHDEQRRHFAGGQTTNGRRAAEPGRKKQAEPPITAFASVYEACATIRQHAAAALAEWDAAGSPRNASVLEVIGWAAVNLAHLHQRLSEAATPPPTAEPTVRLALSAP